MPGFCDTVREQDVYNTDSKPTENRTLTVTVTNKIASVHVTCPLPGGYADIDGYTALSGSLLFFSSGTGKVVTFTHKP